MLLNQKTCVIFSIPYIWSWNVKADFTCVGSLSQCTLIGLQCYLVPRYKDTFLIRMQSMVPASWKWPQNHLWIWGHLFNRDTIICLLTLQSVCLRWNNPCCVNLPCWCCGRCLIGCGCGTNQLIVLFTWRLFVSTSCVTLLNWLLNINYDLPWNNRIHLSNLHSQ